MYVCVLGSIDWPLSNVNLQYLGTEPLWKYLYQDVLLNTRDSYVSM